MSIDDSIAQFIHEKGYATFFNTELKKFFSPNQSKTPIRFNENETKEIPDFERNRLNGENEKYICSLIRQDSVVEFISHVNKTNVNLSKMKIEGNSIFETNPFLMKQSATLIEYAAFYGSINIFKYLRNNNVEIEPRLWLYGIHSNNAEIICLIEELNIKPDRNDYESYLEESIKCHHNEIASYIYDNFIDKTKEIFLENIVRYGFNYNNYFFISDIKNKYTFYYACEFGYINLVDLLIKHTKIDLNKMISSKFTALNLAAKNDNQDILNLLLSQKEIKIDKECFKGCFELTEITIPSTVHVIPEGCFCNCSKLKKVIIPPTVTKIEYKAFSDCSSLEELIIPASVTIIDNCIICNCSSLKRLSIPVSLLSRKIDDHLELLNNENCKYEKMEINGKSNIIKMTDLITNEVFIIKNIPTNYYADRECEFINRVSLFNLGLPTLIPVDKYLLPLFANEENNSQLSEIEVTNEAGETIYKNFGGYIVVSKFIDNYGTLEEIKEKHIESKRIMNPILIRKALFGIASTMKFFNLNKSEFLNFTLDNVLIDANEEPKISFHAAQKFEQYVYNNDTNYFYIAPEIINDYEVTAYADIYSFAFIVYLIFANSVTFDDQQKYSWQRYLMRISTGQRPIKPENIPENYWELIQQCWLLNPISRPLFDVIIVFFFI